METTHARTITIPMRDGVSLHAYVYMPPHMEAPFPVILHLTPYDEREKVSWTTGDFLSTECNRPSVGGARLSCDTGCVGW
jgi:predicted acyl esterase